MSADRTSLQFDEKGAYLGDWLPQVEKIYRSGGRLTVPEIRLNNHRSGEPRWVSQTFYSILDETGAVDRVVILTADITEHKHAKESIEYLLDLERLTNEISVSFVDAAADAIDSAINLSLKKIANFANADRSSLFVISEDLDRLSNTHEWYADPRDSQIDLLQNKALSSFGWHRDYLLQHKTIKITRPDDYPPEANDEKIWVAEHGFRSMLFVPLLKKNRLCGALGFYGPVGQEIAWLPEFADMLKIVGNIILNVLDRKRAEDGLRESETKYRRLSENSPAVVFQFKMSPSGEFSFPYVNEAVKAITGVAAADAMRDASQLIGLVHPDDQQEFLEGVMISAKSLRPYRKELRFVLEGGVKWAEVRATPRAMPDGSILWDGLFVDVSERKQMEAALRAEKQLSGEYVNSLPDLFYVFDKHGLIKWNSEWERIIGYSDEELVGLQITDLFEGEDRGFVAERMSQVFREGNAGVEAELVTKDGRRIPYYFTGIRKKLDGKVCLIGLGIDITGRKQAQEEIAEAHRIQEILLDALPYPTMLIRRDKTIIFANRVAQEVGAKVGGLCWRDFGHCDYISEDDKEYLDTHQSLPCGDTHCTFCLAEEALESDHPSNQPEVHAFGRIWDTHWIPIDDDTYLHFALDVSERKQAEQELRESEERFRSLFEHAPIGYQSLDANGNFLEINETWCRLLGYTKDEVLGRNFSAFIHPDFRRQFAEAFEKFKNLGFIVGVEYVMIKKDGSEIVVSFNGRIGHDENGAFRQTHCVLHDITERKRADEALRESEAELSQAQRIAKVGSWDWSPSTGEMNWSDEMFRICGLEPQECKPTFEAASALIHPDDRTRVTERIKSALNAKKGYLLEYRLELPNGQIKTVELIAEAELDSLGEVGLVYGTIQDISVSKQVEDALRESEEKHRGLLEHLPQKIFHKNANSVYISCNENYAADLGITADEIAGKTDFDLYPKELAEKYQAEDRRLMESGRTEEIEESSFNNGHEVFSVTVKTPLIDDSGNVTGILGIFWDITERKQAEETLKNALERLKSFEQYSTEGVSRVDIVKPVPIDLPRAELVEWVNRHAVLAEANNSLARMYGLKPKEMIGRPRPILRRITVNELR